MSNKKELYDDEFNSEENIEFEELTEENQIEDIFLENQEIEEDPIIEEIIEKISKHKEPEKHKLNYDTIFKGKKEEALDECYIEVASKQQTYELDMSSGYSFERENPVEYNRLSNLRKEMYDIIVNYIKLNIKTTRRKPARTEFNKNYGILVSKLEMTTYSYSEVFIEFAYYFSDNIENMFKFLDKEWGGKIAQELARKGNIRGTKKLDDIDFL